MFDTKIAILILDDLPVWQKLNVTAFLTSGIVGSAPEAMGMPYKDGADRIYAALLGQPVMVFSATSEVLLRARNQALARDLTCAAYVRSMFSTGHDAANREAFQQEPAETPDLVGIGLRGPKKDVDKAIKGGRLHE
ncbi:DUF2000 family protein [Stappia sp.]|uniref:DUF2000 family protein n=1 Tax=Stappia sp. TaxID=1870903 RepID=UPI003D0C5369